ncbi:MAG: enhanced intracellular survival protein Eis, partial [Streptosporangiaceae bacterium]
MPVTGPPLIRPLHPGDDLEAELDLRHRAFGPMRDGARAGWITGLRTAASEGRLLGAFDGPALIGSARFLNMRQWWHGRPVPMAGVAGVKVAPEYRSRGVGRVLMAEMLAEIGRRGYPISVLYPATASVYRSLGWEMAGARYDAVVPIRSLAALISPDASVPGAAREPRAAGQPAGAGRPPAVGEAVGAAAAAGGLAAAGGPAAGAGGPAVRGDVLSRNGTASAVLRRARPQDADEVVAVLAAVHSAASDSGPIIRDTSVFADWLGDERHYAYLAADGFIAYRWAHGHQEILVNRAVAGSASTARAIWSVVASHASMAGRVRGHLAPSDPLSWLVREPDVDIAHRERWMLRLVDAPAAIAARGFPAAVTARVALVL